MPYYPLTNNPILPDNLANKKGVYIVIALRNGVRQPIPRILKTDKNGILYIGQTTDQDFETRIKNFRTVMNPSNAADNHSGALNIKQIKKLRDAFPIESLQVEIFPSETPKFDETKRIEDYRQEFGEVPPLNGSK